MTFGTVRIPAYSVTDMTRLPCTWFWSSSTFIHCGSTRVLGSLGIPNTICTWGCKGPWWICMLEISALLIPPDFTYKTQVQRYSFKCQNGGRIALSQVTLLNVGSSVTAWVACPQSDSPLSHLPGSLYPGFT